MVIIWTEDLKLLKFQFCLFYSLLIIDTFFEQNQLKNNNTFSVKSYIKLLLVFVEFSKAGDKQCQVSSHQQSVFFNRPFGHQSTSNDRLKPVMTTGLVNMHIDRSIANLALKSLFREN